MSANVAHMNQRRPNDLICILTAANQRGAISFPVILWHQRLQKRIHESVVDAQANAGLLNQQLAERSMVSNGSADQPRYRIPLKRTRRNPRVLTETNSGGEVAPPGGGHRPQPTLPEWTRPPVRRNRTDTLVAWIDHIQIARRETPIPSQTKAVVVVCMELSRPGAPEQKQRHRSGSTSPYDKPSATTYISDRRKVKLITNTANLSILLDPINDTERSRPWAECIVSLIHLL